jgi:hypothetical protein
MKIIKSLFYRLGGADYDVLKDCSKKTKVRYQSLAFALFLTVTLAAIGGFDIATQFTTSNPVRAGVAALWAIATLSFDYFLINGGAGKGAFKYVRIFVGLANICITIAALFVLLNQATIDSQIRLDNSGEIEVIDEAYLKAKENRYSAVKTKKAEAEKYNTEVVVPEAKNGYPGPKYAEKKGVYDTMVTAVNEEVVKLDALEQQYLTAYQTKRSALESVQSNDFFAKIKLLPEVMLKGGWLSLVLAGCLFIFLSYIELQAISLKLSISDDDEYHTAEKAHEARTREIRNATAESHVELERRKILLNTSVKGGELEKQEYDVFMNDVGDRIVREAEMRGRIAILRAKGFDTAADSLESELDRFIKTSKNKENTQSEPNYRRNDTSSEGNLPVEEILKFTEPMTTTLESIRNASTPENLAKNIFNWIITNIVYDKGHGQFFCRTAREAYNDGHGICGELSVLYMAFLRASGIDAKFVEVTKDHQNEKVSHACVLVKQSGSQFLSDPAYNSFRTEHAEWNEWNDEKLSAEYCSWNR